MKVRPMNDLVLVRVHPPDNPSSVLFTPNEDRPPVRTGTVLRVGPGRRKRKQAGKEDTVFIPMQLKEGETVVFFAAAANSKKDRLPTQFLSDDEVLIREEDVLCVYEGEGLKVSV
jgi:co-chaperonin GroES (HSP10)